MLDLRPYQNEALQKVYQAYKNGKRRVIVSLPTGTGKTVVFAHFPRFFKMKKRLLVLAHREELLLQARDKFLSVDPDLKVGIEQSSSQAPADAKVVIASVPTLGRAGGTRLSRLNPEEFFLIVVDEAHHAVAPTYQRIFEHFGLLAPGTSRYLVGFTATPRRGDKQGLGAVFQEICYARDLREMIADRYLCPITGWRVNSGTSLDNVKIRHGDFVESQLAEAVNTVDRNNLLGAAYMKLAKGRRAIVFCVNVAHAIDVCEAFTTAGIRAAAVWGDMSPEDRRATIADNSKAHQLPGLNDLFKLPRGLNLRGKDALSTERLIEGLTTRYPWIDIERIHKPEDVKIAAEQIKFWNFDPPDELAGFTRHIWHAIPGGYRLFLNNGESLLVESDLLDMWNVQLRSANGEFNRLNRFPDLKPAIGFADDFIVRERPDLKKLVSRTADWRDEQPSQKQIEVLKRNGIATPPELTKGQAAQMISYILG